MGILLQKQWFVCLASAGSNQVEGGTDSKHLCMLSFKILKKKKKRNFEVTLPSRVLDREMDQALKSSCSQTPVLWMFTLSLIWITLKRCKSKQNVGFHLPKQPKYKNLKVPRVEEHTGKQWFLYTIGRNVHWYKIFERLIYSFSREFKMHIHFDPAILLQCILWKESKEYVKDMPYWI